MNIRELAQFDVVDWGKGKVSPIVAEVLFGLICTAGFVGVRFALDPIAPTAGPYALIYPATLISTLFGRWRSGVVTYVATFLWAWYYLVAPVRSFQFSNPGEVARFGVNIVTVLVIIVFAEVFRRAVRGAVQARDEALVHLQDRDDRLELALSAGRGIGTWDWNVPQGKVFADERFATLYGVDPTRAKAGAPIADFFTCVHPDDASRVQAAIDVALRTGALFSEDYRLVQRDGTSRWVVAEGRCVLGPDGGPMRFPGVSFDITERKASERRREALVALTDRVRDLDDPDELAFAASAILGDTLGVSRVSYGTIDPEAETLAVERDWLAPGVESLAGTLNLRDYGSFIDDLKRGTFVVIPDVDRDERTASAADALKGRSAGAFVNVPVMERNRLVAVLFLNNAEAREWSREDLDLVQEIAEWTRTATERLRAVAALRATNETLEARVEERTADLMAAEEALRQSQKMEAVGQLTGGIAHDFNNLLAGIGGSLEIIQKRIAEGRSGELGRYIDAAQGACRRAATLTQRLLAFSRRQTLVARAIDVNKLIAGIDDLIRRSVGPHIDLEVVGAGGLWTTKIDPSQLENALLNLSINARDAMVPKGGRLTIETANKSLDARAAKARGLPPGQYVSVCVTDTGVGMEPSVIERVFDPFFTTKPTGQGTGLGLSMVYGFVRQSGGQIRIYSEVGKGTTMCLYLPRHVGVAEEADAAEVLTPGEGSGETVLVVDDEATIRMLVMEVLDESGYQAIEACDGPEAMTVLESERRIDLLVTDVGLPGGMNGRQIADAARVRRPGLKVLFITGYAENAAIGNGHLDAGMDIITKPFVMASLGNKIRALIDGGRAESA